MVIKNVIILMASICESMLMDSSKGLIGKKHSFCERVNRMVTKGAINADLCNKLHWLWKKRAGIHLYELADPEYDTYGIADYRKAVATARILRESLDKFHDK